MINRGMKHLHNHPLIKLDKGWKWWEKTGLVIILSFLFAVYCSLILGGIQKCQGAELSLSYQYSIYDNHQLEPSGGFQIELSHNNFSLITSYESTLLRLVGQEAVDIDLLGIGFSVKLIENPFTLEIGSLYYVPEIFEKGNSFREGMWLYINQIYPEGAKKSWISDDIYKYQLHGNIGGHLKIKSSHQLTDSLSFTYSIMYRYLRMKEVFIRDHRNYIPGSWVEFFFYRELSCIMILAGIEYRF